MSRKPIRIETYLDAPPERIAAEVRRSELLLYVSRGVLTFRPLQPDRLPEVWEPGEYKVQMIWKGFLPLGWQVIGIELGKQGPDVWQIRDNGRGAMIRRWDHLIELRPEGEGTRYVDRLDVEAGWLTPFVRLFAGQFYRHRQKRWRRLVANGFDYKK